MNYSPNWGRMRCGKTVVGVKYYTISPMRDQSAED